MSQQQSIDRRTTQWHPFATEIIQLGHTLHNCVYEHNLDKGKARGEQSIYKDTCKTYSQNFGQKTLQVLDSKALPVPVSRDVFRAVIERGSFLVWGKFLGLFRPVLDKINPALLEIGVSHLQIRNMTLPASGVSSVHDLNTFHA